MSRLYSTAFSALHNYAGSEEGGAPAEGHTLVIRDISIRTTGVVQFEVNFKDLYTSLTWLHVVRYGVQNESYHWQGRHVIPYVDGILMGYTVQASLGADPVDVYMSGYDLIA